MTKTKKNKVLRVSRRVSPRFQNPDDAHLDIYPINPIRPIGLTGHIRLISLIGLLGLLGLLAPIRPINPITLINPIRPIGLISPINLINQVSAATINEISPTRLNQGLVGYWSFDGNTTQTGAVRDLSGNNNTGYLTNIATSTFYTAGKIGQGFKFDGVNDYVNVSATLSTRAVSFWVKPNTNTASLLNLTATTYITASGGIVTATGFTAPIVYVNGVVNGTLLANKWNNVLVTDTANVSADAITIGKANSAYTNGVLDDVRIYSRALSPAEVNALYKMGQATINKTPVNRLNKGLVGYWPFDGNTVVNGVAQDKSGNGNNGNLINIATSTFYTAGKIGQGFKFDGVNDYVNVSATLSTRVISFWVKPNTNTASLLNLTATTYITASGGIVTASGFTSPIVYVNGVVNGTLLANKWNNVLVTDTANVSADAITIGKANSAYTNGVLDDVRIYNRALSAAEINALYKMGQATINKTPVNRLNQGLVGYWTFDGKDMVNGHAVDRSSVGTNTGYLVNIATSTFYTAGKIGQGLKFNGNSNYVQIPDRPVYTLTAGYTLSAWIQLASTPTTTAYVVSQWGAGGVGYAAWLGAVSTSRFLIMGNHDGAHLNIGVTLTDNTSALTLRRWYLATYVYTGGVTGTNAYLYLNGTLVKSGAFDQAPQDSSYDVYISRNGIGANFFPGLIDDVRIYNRALSAAEVKQLYNMGR